MTVKMAIRVVVVATILCLGLAGSGSAEELTGVTIGSPGYRQQDGVYDVWDRSYDIWNQQDSFYFINVPVSGDFVMTVRVLGIEETDHWAKVGLMVRETLEADSKNVVAVATAPRRVGFQYRPGAGDWSQGTHSDPGAFSGFPILLKLERVGNTFIGSYSLDDGSTWPALPDGETSVNMATDAYVGLCVTSHTGGATCTAELDNVVLPGVDFATEAAGKSIGTNVYGFYEFEEGTHYIEDRSFDIFGEEDTFTYPFTPLSGAGQITARVVDVSPTSGWTKAGVMIRETLDPDSKHAMMIVTPDGLTSFQHRKQDGNRSYAANRDAMGFSPLHLKIERSEDNVFTGYFSEDGTTWIEQPNTWLDGGDAARNGASIDMAEDVYIGLCLSSGNAWQTALAVFDDVVCPEVIVPCDYYLAGDVNDDCRVDFSDCSAMADEWLVDFDFLTFTEMASNWLIDCSLTPEEPACMPK